jgi:hypothetical protein
MMLRRSAAEINRIDFLVYLIQTPDRPVEFPLFAQIRREDSYMSKMGDWHFLQSSAFLFTKPDYFNCSLAECRGGDNYVDVFVRITMSGEKSADRVRANLDFPGSSSPPCPEA